MKSLAARPLRPRAFSFDSSRIDDCTTQFVPPPALRNRRSDIVSDQQKEDKRHAHPQRGDVGLPREPTTSARPSSADSLHRAPEPPGPFFLFREPWRDPRRESARMRSVVTSAARSRPHSPCPAPLRHRRRCVRFCISLLAVPQTALPLRTVAALSTCPGDASSLGARLVLPPVNTCSTPPAWRVPFFQQPANAWDGPSAKQLKWMNLMDQTARIDPRLRPSLPERTVREVEFLFG